MNKISLLFLLLLGSINVFAADETPNNVKKEPSLLVPKCENANFQYKTCIDSEGREILNPKFVEYSQNNPERRGIKRSPHVYVQ